MEVYSVKIWTPITEKYDEGNMVETHETSLYMLKMVEYCSM